VAWQGTVVILGGYGLRRGDGSILTFAVAIIHGTFSSYLFSNGVIRQYLPKGGRVRGVTVQPAAGTHQNPVQAPIRGPRRPCLP
jgi:hypothetical protein